MHSIRPTPWPWTLRIVVRQRAALLAAMLATIATIGCGKHTLEPISAVDTRVPARSSVDQAELECRRRLEGRVLHLEGRTGAGALWVLDKPAQWNGDLVVYMHGYTDPAQPIALPHIDAIRDSLEARGFAVALSSFSSNGYAVREGVHETRQVSEIFASRVARPHRTYLFGVSLGGLIGMILSQQSPHLYDGSLLVCGVVGGSDDEVQYMGDIRVLFDAVYGDSILPGGLEHPPAVTDVQAQVVRPVVAAVQRYPQGLGIIQALARRPLPGANSQEVVQSLVTVLGFAMQGSGDLLARTHGHSFFDNASWRYTSPALPPSVVDGVNAKVARSTVAPDAAQFLARWGEPAGPFRIPVITLHTTRDPVVPAFHEDLLGQAATGPLLIQRRVERYGHVQFTVGELMVHFDDLVTWSNGRRKHAA